MAENWWQTETAALSNLRQECDAISGLKLADLSMRELKDDLASLRIDREAPHRNRWRVPLLVLVLIAVLVVGGFYWQTHASSLRRYRGRDLSAHGREQQRPERRHAHPHGFGIPGGPPSVRRLVEDSGPHL